MFQKILIANRGEIACRIMKTARRMGIKTVAVYSEADRDAVHVDMADEAVLIGPAPAAQSYLDAGRIIEAAKQTGAEAIHPGYGFLSENAAFAGALEAAGIAFIGPNVHALRAMGDKIESKKAAAAARVSTVPGYLGVIESPEQAISKGFLTSAAEAKSSFGDDRVFIEKFIENPRHIEIQVLGDKHGNVIHAFERECSIQRRNQKVIEEAPSPFLDERTRRAMGEQAVALAKAVNYESAGTVEFIVDPKKNFYFLEMNTRLQVEHPVTEMITGLDLVELMIRIAVGEKLPFRQADLKINGWAVESRVYAEDPFRNFLPSIGRLVRYRPPVEGPREGGIAVRTDTGTEEGGEISLYYDPMIAKLITHGPSREAAIEAQAAALDAFYIDGIEHNIPFLAALMQHPRWRQGNLSTGFIAEEFAGGFKHREPEGDTRDVLVSVAAAIDHLNNVRRRHISGQLPNAMGLKLGEMRVCRIGTFEQRLRVAGSLSEETAVELCGLDGSMRRELALRSDWWPGQPLWQGKVGGKKVSVQVRPVPNGYDLSYGGIRAKAYIYTAREAELAALMPEKKAAGTSKKLLCPMPGLVVSIAVAEGQEVKAGEPLAVVEAMKMQNVLKAGCDVTVSKLRAKPGDSLAVDAIIMEFA
ncbi:MAG: acetyl/propionyl/methylcrotonyl-CoA carboxylase subunit alpha [Rhodomicrobium sp.]|nr:acetyl/propionyl/methylcrotonyl-CoA carboxylase subunit alpha [Rhodomicrobium sp.]